MEKARENGIEWWSFKVDNWPLVAQSPWWPVLSRRQQDALTFNMVQHPEDDIVFRNIQPSLGMGRCHKRNEDQDDDRVIMGTMMPAQVMYVFDGKIPRDKFLGGRLWHDKISPSTCWRSQRSKT